MPPTTNDDNTQLAAWIAVATGAADVRLDAYMSSLMERPPRISGKRDAAKDRHGARRGTDSAFLAWGMEATDICEELELTLAVIAQYDRSTSPPARGEMLLDGIVLPEVPASLLTDDYEAEATKSAAASIEATNKELASLQGQMLALPRKSPERRDLKIRVVALDDAIAEKQRKGGEVAAEPGRCTVQPR